MFYVYEFIDPRDDSVFYIGKGTSNRIKNKRYKKDNSHLFYKIRSIRKEGLREIRRKIKFFTDEDEAYQYEISLIEKLGLKNLCNISKGGRTGSAICGKDHPNWLGDYLNGKKFNRLLVLQRAEKNKRGKYLFLCQCECSQQISVVAHKLLSGHTKSCGCLKDKNLTGQNFGRLKVLQKIGTHHRMSIYLCQCICGNTCKISHGHLKTGHTKSCGCLKKQKSLGNKHGASLTWSQVKEIRLKYASGEFKQPALADQYGVGQPSISNIIKQKTWKEADERTTKKDSIL